MSSIPQTRPNRGLLVGLGLFSLLIAMWSTFTTMAQTWWRSDTFAHGLFVVPIVLYLIYENRATLLKVPKHTDLRALGMIVVLAFGWALAHVINVQVGQQLTAMLLVPALVWLLIGWPATKTIAFPLGFLLLAVPAGEGLIPILIEFTADFVTKALRISGIPVFREGHFLIIPTGRWSVVTGCSGIRYLMATVTVALLFAYLNYRAAWRRLVFVLVAIAVSIIGNGFRAYGIVMIGHLSGMKYAVGADHLFYGWVFFGIIVFVLFWFGTLWREPQDSDAAATSTEGADTKVEAAAKSMLGAVVAIVVLAFWPAFFALTQTSVDPNRSDELSLPNSSGAWQLTGPTQAPWDIKFRGATLVTERIYRKGEAEIGVYLGYYSTQTQDVELINAKNVLLYEKDPQWRRLSNETKTIGLGGDELKVLESELNGLASNLLTWRWYWIAGRTTTDPYLAKAYQALASFSGRSSSGAVIIVYTKVPGELSAPGAEAVLEDFVGEFYRDVDEILSAIEADD